MPGRLLIHNAHAGAQAFAGATELVVAQALRFYFANLCLRLSNGSCAPLTWTSCWAVGLLGCWTFGPLRPGLADKSPKVQQPMLRGFHFGCHLVLTHSHLGGIGDLLPQVLGVYGVSRRFRSTGALLCRSHMAVVVKTGLGSRFGW